MSARTRERATYQDVIDAPENMVAELIDGELFLSPRPRWKHSRISSRLGMIIGPPYERGQGGPGGWIIVDEPELHLDAHVLVPDMAGWRVERVSYEPLKVGMDIPPDWVCEVLSPSTGRLDRAKKLPIFAMYGVSYAWLIHPLERTLTAFRLENGRWSIIATHAGEDKVAIEPFTEVTLDLTELWGPDDPPSE